MIVARNTVNELFAEGDVDVLVLPTAMRMPVTIESALADTRESRDANLTRNTARALWQQRSGRQEIPLPVYSWPHKRVLGQCTQVGIMRAALLIAMIASLCTGCGGGGGGGTSPPAASPPPPPGLNLAPTVAKPIPDVRAINKHHFSYDATQGGTTFVDGNGDRLTYRIEMNGSFTGLSESNGTISGMLQRSQIYENEHINVEIFASDGRGGSASTEFRIDLVENSPPTVARPNLALVTMPGVTVNRDLTQGGTTFIDVDGDRLTYAVEYIVPSSDIRIVGLSAVGALTGVGAVGLRITADDGLGASASDTFLIAVAVDASSAPVLPDPPYVYADAELPLPYDFRNSSDTVLPFWDTSPAGNRTSNAGARLGRVLFYDKRLSITNTLSCASCHQQSHGFASPERFNTGVLGAPLRRNAMGLSNVRYNQRDRYFSDLRARTLESLALMPIIEPTELGTPVSMLVQELTNASFYPPLFEEAFGTPEITGERIALALAQFLRSLISYSSRFDQVFTVSQLSPRRDWPLVFSQQEIEGKDLFEGMRCNICHGSDVQTLDNPSNNGLDAVITDPGFDGTGKFRAASLRNIEFTAPYMHDGRFATLREVVDHYDHGVVQDWTTSSFLRVVPNPTLALLTEPQKLALEAFMRTMSDPAFLADPRFSDPFP